MQEPPHLGCAHLPCAGGVWWWGAGGCSPPSRGLWGQGGSTVPSAEPFHSSSSDPSAMQLPPAASPAQLFSV